MSERKPGETSVAAEALCTLPKIYSALKRISCDLIKHIDFKSVRPFLWISSLIQNTRQLSVFFGQNPPQSFHKTKTFQKTRPIIGRVAAAVVAERKRDEEENWSSSNLSCLGKWQKTMEKKSNHSRPLSKPTLWNCFNYKVSTTPPRS